MTEINAKKNKWENFKRKVKDPEIKIVVACLEELQTQINEIRAELERMGTDGK